MTTENKRIEGWIEGVTTGTPAATQVRYDVNVPQVDSQIKVLYSGITHTFPSTEKTQAAIESRVPFDAVVTTQAQLKAALEDYAIGTIFINKGRSGLLVNGLTASIPDASQKAIYGSPLVISTTSTITTDPIAMTNVYFYNDLIVNNTATLNLADTGSPGVASYFVTNLNRSNPHYLAGSIGGTITTSAYTVFKYEYVEATEIPTFTGTGAVSKVFWTNTAGNDPARAFATAEANAGSTTILGISTVAEINITLVAMGTLKNFTVSGNAFTYTGTKPIEVLVQLACNGRAASGSGAVMDILLQKNAVTQTAYSKQAIVANINYPYALSMSEILSVVTGDIIVPCVRNTLTTDPIIISEMQMNIEER